MVSTHLNFALGAGESLGVFVQLQSAVLANVALSSLTHYTKECPRDSVPWCWGVRGRARGGEVEELKEEDGMRSGSEVVEVVVEHE